MVGTVRMYDRCAGPCNIRVIKNNEIETAGEGIRAVY